MSIKEFLKNEKLAIPLTTVEYFSKGYFLRKRSYVKTDKQRALLESMIRDGYCTIPDYLDRQSCARLCSELDNLFEEHPSYLHRDAADSDVRLFGAEVESEAARRFSEDQDLLCVSQSYLGTDLRTGFTLANRVSFAPGNLGSGGGWHRDSFVGEIKALLYLSDVSPAHGPFQLIKNSNFLGQMLKDIRKGRLRGRQNRISEAVVDRIVGQDKDRVITFSGTAGTLILADTSAIHRGMPIETGMRYALTNYYWPLRGIDEESLRQYYAPILSKRG